MMPVVMYTAQTSDKVIDESFRNGANLYMTKSNKFEELVAKLKTVFAIDWRDYLHYPRQDQFVLGS